MKHFFLLSHLKTSWQSGMFIGRPIWCPRIHTPNHATPRSSKKSIEQSLCEDSLGTVSITSLDYVFRELYVIYVDVLFTYTLLWDSSSHYSLFIMSLFQFQRRKFHLSCVFKEKHVSYGFLTSSSIITIFRAEWGVPSKDMVIVSGNMMIDPILDINV